MTTTGTQKRSFLGYADPPGLKLCEVPAHPSLKTASLVIQLEDASGQRIAAFPNVEVLHMSFTRAEVLDVSQNGNFPDFLFDWLETTVWKPRSRPLTPEESWLLIVRGGGGYAAGLDVAGSAENVGLTHVYRQHLWHSWKLLGSEQLGEVALATGSR
jgi:hypothetical protein